MSFCKQCNQEKPEDEMWLDWQCEDCFDKMLEIESHHFDIHAEQGGNCAVCGTLLSGWIVKDEKAICWPSCKDKLPPPIELKREHFIL